MFTTPFESEKKTSRNSITFEEADVVFVAEGAGAPPGRGQALLNLYLQQYPGGALSETRIALGSCRR